jgi:hypothetical protein
VQKYGGKRMGLVQETEINSVDGINEFCLVAAKI